jgi:hypothetical protein
VHLTASSFPNPDLPVVPMCRRFFRLWRHHRDFEELWYGLGGTLTVTVDGVAHRLQTGDALFVPRGAVHRFDNLDTGVARALISLTPAVAGKKYFEEIGAIVNAGGPPDMARVKAVMEKYGLIPV